MLAFLDSLCDALIARDADRITRLLAHPLARALPGPAAPIHARPDRLGSLVDPRPFSAKFCQRRCVCPSTLVSARGARPPDFDAPTLKARRGGPWSSCARGAVSPRWLDVGVTSALHFARPSAASRRG